MSYHAHKSTVANTQTNGKTKLNALLSMSSPDFFASLASASAFHHTPEQTQAYFADLVRAMNIRYPDDVRENSTMTVKRKLNSISSAQDYHIAAAEESGPSEAHNDTLWHDFRGTAMSIAEMPNSARTYAETLDSLKPAREAFTAITGEGAPVPSWESLKGKYRMTELESTKSALPAERTESLPVPYQGVQLGTDPSDDAPYSSALDRVTNGAMKSTLRRPQEKEEERAVSAQGYKRKML